MDIFASDDTEALSPDGCAALGGLLQFTAVAQFLWIAALVSFVDTNSGHVRSCEVM